MRLVPRNELPALVGLVLAFSVAYLLLPTPVVLRTVGPLVVLFLPGYAITAALAPGRDDLTIAERFGISLGVSMSAMVVLVLMWSFAPTGISNYTTLATLVVITLVASLVAWVRRSRLPMEQRFVLQLAQTKLPWGDTRGAKLASGFVAVAALAAAGSFIVGFYFPKTGERFTEFYVLNQRGVIGDYPRVVELGAPQQVTLGIANREGRRVSYRAVTLLDGIRTGSEVEAALAPGETQERLVTITASRAGKQKVEFLLYRSGDSIPYRSLHLWLDVKSPNDRYTEFLVDSDIQRLYNLGQALPYRIYLTNHEGRTVYYQVYTWKSWTDEDPQQWYAPGESGVVELAPGQGAILEGRSLEITFDPTREVGYLDIILAKTGPAPLTWGELDPSMLYRVVRLPLYSLHSKA